MRRCIVSMTGKDGQRHETKVEGSSLFDAAHRAIYIWSKLWWYTGDGLIEVRGGGKIWRVKAGRVSQWYAEKFRRRRS